MSIAFTRAVLVHELVPWPSALMEWVPGGNSENVTISESY